MQCMDTFWYMLCMYPSSLPSFILYFFSLFSILNHRITGLIQFLYAHDHLHPGACIAYSPSPFTRALCTRLHGCLLQESFVLHALPLQFYQLVIETLGNQHPLSYRSNGSCNMLMNTSWCFRIHLVFKAAVTFRLSL